jgi:hypothetical protein
MSRQLTIRLHPIVWSFFVESERLLAAGDWERYATQSLVGAAT